MWTATAAPSNLLLNNNILYINGNANNYLYAEGYLNNPSGSIKNGYAALAGITADATNNLVIDNNFNTACGSFKAFMQNNASCTFTEDNLIADGNDFYPAGASLAKNAGAAINSPSITVDANNVTRNAYPDMGAYEFTGTASDQTGPIISYVNFPDQNCLVNPTFNVSISDATGVNNTTGFKPRLYYKHSVDDNNISGWKYVEGVNTAGNAYTFIPNYLSIGGVVAGDTIQYFIVAQDNIPNTGSNNVILNGNGCLTSVDLQSTAFPVSAYKSYILRNPSTLTVNVTTSPVCPGVADTFIARITRNDVASIGSGVTPNALYAPVGPGNGRRLQVLYLAGEMRNAGLRAGNITALAFTAGNGVAVPAAALTVNIGNYSNSSLGASASLAFAASPGLTTFSGTVTVINGINKINFTTPFNWDGTSNVLVEFCHPAMGAATTSPGVTNTAVGSYRCIQGSGSSACGLASATGYTSRMNIIFTGQIDASAAYSNYTWNDGTSNAGSNNDSLFLVPPFLSGNTMNYNVSINDGFGCSLSGNTNVTKIVSPIDLSTSNATNNCNGTTGLLDAGVGINANWSPVTGLYTDANATTPYVSGPLHNVFTKLNNNHYVKASYNNGICAFVDSILVTVPGIAGAINVSATTMTDSAVMNGTTDIHTSNCELIATITPSGGTPVAGSVKATVTIDGAVQTSGGAPYLTRYFEIKPINNSNAATANVKLYFTQADFTAYNNYVQTQGATANYPLMPANSTDGTAAVNIKISKFEGTGATPANNTGVSVISNPAVTWNASRNLWEVTFPVAGFSTFYIHTNLTNTPLPVRFANFTATAEKASNLLNWTMGDINTKGNFEILHSVDGIAFESVSNQKANNRNKYSFEHLNPRETEVYQIKFTDATGKVYYSPTQMIQRKVQHQLAVMLYPNPVAENNVKVSVVNAHDPLLSYSITDVLGKEMLKGNIATTNNNANITIDVSKLANGIYSFKLQSGNDQVVKRLVVANK